MMNGNPPPERTYFTIIPASNAGFTDQLMRFSAFYKLGLSLGYSYLHTPFTSWRSSNVVGSKLLEWLDRLPSFLYPLGAFLVRRLLYDVYYFLGFNQHFERRPEDITQLNSAKNVVDLRFSDPFLEANGIASFEELQAFIRTHVAKETGVDGSTPLVRFRLTGKRTNLFTVIHRTIPNFQDQLSLRASYFEARKRNPWTSEFADGKVRVLVHIRQGDIAVLETPTKTFIPLDSRAPGWLSEHSKFEDIRSNLVFQVREYYDFVKGLTSYFDDEIFDILFFSDGYQRAFDRLESNIDKSHVSADNIRALRKNRASYDEKSFGILHEIRNSRCFIGETRSKLYGLIDSTLNADIIITTTQQRMLAKLATFYCNDDSPIIIILYKDKPPSYKDLRCDDEERFIYVDVHHPNYSPIVDRIRSRLTARGDTATRSALPERTS